MTLTFCRDPSAADWITHSDLPWSQLVTFGPAGFDAYARLRLLPDPTQPGQSENDAEQEDWRVHQLRRLFEVLAAHTATPDDCYFCVWEGFGIDTARIATARMTTATAGYINSEADAAAYGRPEAQPGRAPQPPSGSTTHLPRVVVPHREYWLFRGPLIDVGTWDTARGWPTEYRLPDTEPAFAWPADHAWCVTKDVDPHWAALGGPRTMIAQLTSDPRLDVVPANPTDDQPSYR